jgi:hypothetical protein
MATVAVIEWLVRTIFCAMSEAASNGDFLSMDYGLLPASTTNAHSIAVGSI